MIASGSPLELVPAAVTLLADGEPVELARLADAAGWPVASVRAALAGLSGADWDEAGRLAGLGLTLRPTPHRFILRGHTLFTWCAMDTLLFPLILDEAAQVISTCPATRQPVSLTVSADGVSALAPAGAVVSEAGVTVSGTGAAGTVADVRSQVCDNGHFFVSAAAAAEWQARNPGGSVRPVAAAFAAARGWHLRAGWASGEIPCGLSCGPGAQ